MATVVNASDLTEFRNPVRAKSIFMILPTSSPSQEGNTCLVLRREFPSWEGEEVGKKAQSDEIVQITFQVVFAGR